MSTIRKLWRLLPLRLRAFLMSKVEQVYDFWVMWVDCRSDRSHNVLTTESHKMSLSSRAKAAFDDGTFVWSTPYYQLKKLKKLVEPKPSDVLLDLGSGPGRVCFEFAHSEIGKCVGIELDGRAYQRSLENLASYTGSSDKIKFINGDVLDYSLTDETIFYLCNPFGAKTMEKLMDNIVQYVCDNSREVRILYHNSVWHDVVVESQHVRLTGVMKGFRKPIYVYTVSYQKGHDGRAGKVFTSTVSEARL